MTWILLPKSGSHQGRHWDLSTGPLTIGRSLACDIVIDDPCISRRHCRLFSRGEQICLEDLGSSHLALVNGEAVREGIVQAGDTISLGMTSFTIALGSQSPNRDHVKCLAEETRSLFDDEICLDVDEHATTLLEGRPRTSADLVELFKLGRALSQTKRRDDLHQRCVAHIERCLSPTSIGIVISSRLDSAPHWYPEVSGSDPLFTAARERSVSENKATLRPTAVNEGGNRCLGFVMTAPLSVHGEALGAIFVRSTVSQRVYDEADLNLLLSIAQVAAPYYQTLGHISKLEDEVAALDRNAGGGCPLLGKSRAMVRVRALIRDVARTPLNVLIAGETGTGKELAAQMIHDGSERASGPMIAVNCASIPDHLFESEMFGHEKGAFTGAEKKRRGRFELAHEGTLFLDEIGELTSENQARLLRVLESGHFHPVGSEKESHADVRIVAATNRDLARSIQDGRFRRDLYHRICTVGIDLPALRQRPSDIPLLAQHFVNEYAAHTKHTRPSLTEDALGYLQELPWSGNVRELRNAMERATALAKDAHITPKDFAFLKNLLPANDVNGNGNGNPPSNGLAPLAEVERKHITHVLERCNYNISKAARILGIHRNTLHNKIAEYGIGG